MKRKKKKKYSLGTGKNGVVRHYIESPNETLVENDIAMARAREKANNNAWGQGLDLFGNMAMQYGLSMAGGSGGAAKGIGQGFGNIFGGAQQMGNGGKVKKNPGADKKSIKVLQRRLKEEGLYTGKIDGLFGKNTQAAYEAFEAKAAEGGQESGFIPLNIKSLFNDVAGSKSDITRKSLSEDELAALQDIVRTNLSQGRNTISYDDFKTDELPSAKGEKPKTEGKLSVYDKLTDPYYKLKTTVGRANIVTTPTDTLVIDTYDFNDAKKEKGSFDNYIKNLKENPSLYNAARGLGTNFGSADGEGASVIINTNANKKAVTKQASSEEEEEGFFMSLFNSVFGDEEKAYGGKVQGARVEVEGGEVGEAPNGQMIDFKGPSHENGGIGVELPEGTEIFSKRIKVGGKTMAERKKARRKKIVSLEKLLEKNGDDIVLKNTVKRTKRSNEIEEQKDQELQEMVGAMQEVASFAYGTGKNGVRKMEYANGGTIFGNLFSKIFGGKQTGPVYNEDGFLDPSSVNFKSDNASNDLGISDSTLTPGVNDFSYGDETILGENVLPGEKSSMNFPNFTGGDLVGMAGTIYSAFEPMKNTQANRAGDTPNINMFKDFGNDALDRIEEAKGYVGQQRDKALKDLETSRTRTTRANRNTARGVNTLRALDLATDVNANEAQADIYDNFSKNMMDLLSKQAGFENQQDQAVMSGEQARDLADRQDRDNYYTQIAEDIATKGQGIQQIGKMLNQNKYNTAAEQAVNDSSVNFQYDNGVLTDKAGNPVMSQVELEQAAKSMGITVDQYISLLNQQNNG